MASGRREWVVDGRRNIEIEERHAPDRQRYVVTGGAGSGADRGRVLQEVEVQDQMPGSDETALEVRRRRSACEVGCCDERVGERTEQAWQVTSHCQCAGIGGPGRIGSRYEGAP